MKSREVSIAASCVLCSGSPVCCWCRALPERTTCVTKLQSELSERLSSMIDLLIFRPHLGH